MQKFLECSIYAEIFNCNAFSHVGLVVDLIWACVRGSKKSGLIASRKLNLTCLVFVLIYSDGVHFKFAISDGVRRIFTRKSSMSKSKDRMNRKTPKLF